MARKNIGLSITLDGKVNVRKDLEEIFKYVNENKKIKLEFDTSSLNNLTELKKALNEIQNNVTKLSSEKILNTNELKNSNKDIDNVANKINSLEAQKGKISSTSVKFVDGKAVQDITNLNQGLGYTSKIITDLNSKVQTVISTNNIEKQEKTVDSLTNKYNNLAKQIEKIQQTGKLNNSVFNTKQFDNFKNIDFNNVEQANKKLLEMKNAISQLKDSASKIDTLQKALDKIRNSYNNLRTGDNKDIFSSLNSSEINNYKNSMKDLENIMKRLKGGSSTVTDLEITKGVTNAANKIKTLQNEFNKNLNIDQMLNKASTAMNNFVKSSSQLNPNLVKEIQNQFNSFNTNSSKQQIQEFIDKLNSIGTNNKSVADITNQINNISAKYKDMVKSLGTDALKSDSVKNYISQFRDAMQQLDNSRNILKNGGFIDTSQIKTELNNLKITYSSLIKEVKNFYDAQKTSTNTQDDKIINKIQVLKSTFENLNKTKLNPSFITELENKINSFNTNTPIKEINKLTTTIKGLSSNSNDITRIQNKFNSLQSSLNNVEKVFSGKIATGKGANELQALKNELTNLQNIMNQLANGKTFKSNEISSVLSSATLKSTELNRALGNTYGIFAKLQNTLSKFGIYASMAVICRQLFQEIKEGVQYVKYLDDSFTDMNMTMDISKNEFNNMSYQIDAMADSLGTSIESVHDIGRVYANASTSVEEIMKSVKGASELSNISGMSGEDTTKAIQSIVNQFQLMSKEGADAGEVTSHVGDVLTTVSQNMKYDFASGIQELNEAISTSGSVAEMSGVSLEKYASTIGALIQQTGKSGSELGQAYKMISARVKENAPLYSDI